MTEVISISFSVLFWMVAARSNAIMDTLAHHYSTSIFSDKDKYPEIIWNPEKSWTNKYVNGDKEQGFKKVRFLFWDVNIFMFMTDKWHLYKSLMLVFMVNSIVTYRDLGWFWNLVMFAVYGVVWILTFNIYYNKILKK